MFHSINEQALFFFVIILLSLGGCLASEEYARYSSPDKKYSLVVYRIPLLIAMPGGGSDASGYVHVYDAKGKIVCQQNVDFARDVGIPEWFEDKVTAGGGVDCRF
jgi:hypothetical protein